VKLTSHCLLWMFIIFCGETLAHIWTIFCIINMAILLGLIFVVRLSRTFALSNLLPSSVKLLFLKFLIRNLVAVNHIPRSEELISSMIYIALYVYTSPVTLAIRLKWLNLYRAADFIRMLIYVLFRPLSFLSVS
ncbi:hypothetical protein L9F63_010292, partial [Diploptera punctata]